MKHHARTALSILACIIIVLLASCSSSSGGSGSADRADFKDSPSRWQAVDKAVTEISKKEFTSIDELAAALDAVASDDWEKTRAVWWWVTHNIAYNVDYYFNGGELVLAPEDVLISGMSVCSGYSRLFVQIASRIGLEVMEVSGYAKGYGHHPGVDPGGTNHAWNAVFLDGEWHLFDSTWGAGSVSNEEFHWMYKEFYFDTPPAEFVYSHYPEDPAFQLLDDPISREFYFQLPKMSGYAFSNGIDPLEYMEIIRAGEEAGLPMFQNCRVPATLEEFPIRRSLTAGEEYEFSIRTESSFVMVSQQNHEPVFYENSDGRIQFRHAPVSGSDDIVIFITPRKVKRLPSREWYALIVYEVED